MYCNVINHCNSFMVFYSPSRYHLLSGVLRSFYFLHKSGCFIRATFAIALLAQLAKAHNRLWVGSLGQCGRRHFGNTYQRTDRTTYQVLESYACDYRCKMAHCDRFVISKG